MRYWTGVLSAFGAGLGIGAGLGMILTEDKVRKEYEESARSLRRAMEIARDLDAEAPMPYENLLNSMPEAVLISGGQEIEEVIGGAPEGVNIGGASLHPILAENNPYHVPPATTTQQFVEGSPNEYGISYIEEEEWDEEDGRTKYQVNYYVDSDTQQPVFVLGGNVIDDWPQRLGESIVSDFYTLIPPGAPDVLYVRNHTTDEDYEVTFGMP